MNKVVEVLERKTVFVSLKTYPTINAHYLYNIKEGVYVQYSDIELQ